MAQLAADGFRQVALAGRVLDQKYLAGADHAAFAVARRDLDRGIEVDDVLPARRGMPVEVIVAWALAENDAGCRQALGKPAAVPLLDPGDLDIAEMRFAVGVDIEVVNAHGFPPPRTFLPCGHCSVRAGV